MTLSRILYSAVRMVALIISLACGGLSPTFAAEEARRHEADISGTVHIFVVDSFGAVPDDEVDDTYAIQKTVDHATSNGGGIVRFSAGVYIVSNGNRNAEHWDNQVAIWIRGNNIHLKGTPRATTIKLRDHAHAHVIKFGQRVGTSVAIDGGSVQDLEIDGNRAKQHLPTAEHNHWNLIDVASNSKHIVLKNLRLREAAYYGIGMQRDGIKDAVVENVTITRTGADGLDWKNDSGTGRGLIRNLTVRDFGLLKGLPNPQAGVDLRSGIYAENIQVNMPKIVPNLVGVRVLGDMDGRDSETAPLPTRIFNIAVLGAGASENICLRLAARHTTIRNAHLARCGEGVRVSRPDNKITDSIIERNIIGIRLMTDPTNLATPENFTLEDVELKNNMNADIIAHPHRNASRGRR